MVVYPQPSEEEEEVEGRQIIMDKMVVRGEVQDFSMGGLWEVPAVEPLARGIMAAYTQVQIWHLVAAVGLVHQEVQTMEVMEHNTQLREHPSTMVVVVLELVITVIWEPVVWVGVAIRGFRAQMVLEEERVHTILAVLGLLLQSKAVMELLFYSFLVIIKDEFVVLIHYFM